MVTRYNATLNAKSLSDVDPSIIILDIGYSGPMWYKVTGTRARRHGLRVYNKIAQHNSVTIEFEIHEQDTMRRQEVLRRVQRWARDGGKLRTSDRPAQQLDVECEIMPAITSALRWTEKLQITFSAYDLPFWADINPTVKTVSTGDANGTMYVGGTADRTFVSAEVTNTGTTTINTLTISAADTAFSFEGLGLAAGQKLSVGYDEGMNLYIRIGNESRMSKRTADSSDDLSIPCSAWSSVGITTTGTASATFSARGLYL